MTAIGIYISDCPFCGNSADHRPLRLDGGYEFQVIQCNICGARGPLRCTFPEAVDAWNRRAWEVGE